MLVEGWAFAPRQAGGLGPFWDPVKLGVNDEAIIGGTDEELAALRAYGVHWIVVDRTVSMESPRLRTAATLTFDNGRMAVYRLG